jgi:hypothetical protein
MALSHCRLTVKLRGRPEAPIKCRGRTLSSRARGADTQAVHGPLQRLLDGIAAASGWDPRGPPGTIVFSNHRSKLVVGP